MAVRVDYLPEGTIQIWESPRLTKRIFDIISEEVIFEAMNSYEHDAVAEIAVGDIISGLTGIEMVRTSHYFVVCDTWQEFTRVYGQVNVFKDNLDTLPLYTKYLVLAD